MSDEWRARLLLVTRHSPLATPRRLAHRHLLLASELEPGGVAGDFGPFLRLPDLLFFVARLTDD